ncbi:MAG: flavodoxin family protein [Planctomycetota bacterium]
MTKILAINGSYRADGIIDQTVGIMAQAAREAGAEVDVVLLREYPIGFCLNCRVCTQQPGDTPAECVQHDGMQALVNKIEEADGYIFASPTNFGSVTAVFKRFMERLVVYGYWPWEMNAPKYRKAHVARKKAILVSSCAAPGIMGRWVYSTQKQLNMVSKTIHAEAVGTLFIGLIAKEARPWLRKRVQAKARALAMKLFR